MLRRMDVSAIESMLVEEFGHALEGVTLLLTEKVRAKRPPRRSFAVLREAPFAGEADRARVPLLKAYEERAARKVTSALVNRDTLVAESSRAPLRLELRVDAVKRWFPRLYPSSAGGQA